METGKGIALPDDFATCLQAQPQLLHTFEQMRPSCQRGYVDWINAGDERKPRDQRIERVLVKIGKWGERHHLMN
ncbi:MAG TPA: YdeI/OmpD-associated family protein [Phototrophicaceae bacterium]|nr:YdeI/OmpD-associated family protein [Phototrophicaceae bacterium]